MRTLARLSFRLQRFELISAMLLVAVVCVAAVVVRGHLDALGASPACFSDWFRAGGAAASGDCGATVGQFFAVDNAEAAPVMAAMAALPMIVGLLLGVGLVGREIETGTAGPAWAIAASRRRWLVARVAPMVMALIVLMGVAWLASDYLAIGRQPWVPAGQSFADVGAHGPSLVVRAIAAFAIALLVGAALGRVLPAVIVAAAVIFVIWVGSEAARSLWLSAEARHHVLTRPPDPITMPGSTYLQSMSQGPDGTLLSDAEALSLAPPDVDPFAWLAAHYTGVYLSVPGTEYPTWALIEMLEFGTVAGVGLILAIPVVDRRRPS